ncbi:MAG TPA: YeeE/YedE thiosulfate transporter family protein [Bacteroidales bacterium]|nr:YeeE/YedE thiosulfate transporter family protein [Bacteroidales bacterium]
MILTLIFGFLFGAILQYSRLNRYNTISGMAMLKDFTMAKAIAVAIGLGMIFISVEVALGLASYHIKPLLLVGVIAGGLIFGTGMAILGYCPGTIPISMGEGSVDAFIGFLGALAGGIIYTLIVPSIKGMLGPDLGQIAFSSMFAKPSALFFVIIFFLGIIIVAVAFWLNRIELGKNYRWLISGTGLAMLTSLIFMKSLFDRVLGASTTYPYLGDFLTGMTNNDYYKSSIKSGNWELIFLAGAFLSGLVLSLFRKDFRLTLIHDNWLKTRGNSRRERIVWAFVGGFLLILGARMAGGCTSGHIISGGMQLALSSWMFAIFVFAAFLITGKFFYKKS